jgi:hypothetical protein
MRIGNVRWVVWEGGRGGGRGWARCWPLKAMRWWAHPWGGEGGGVGPLLATYMMLRLPGTFCPYRNVHTWPAVICARLRSCIIERVCGKIYVMKLLHLIKVMTMYYKPGCRTRAAKRCIIFFAGAGCRIIFLFILYSSEGWFLTVFNKSSDPLKFHLFL